MSFIKTAPQVLEARRARRWITVLDADDMLELPKLEFNIGCVTDKRLLGLYKPFRKRDGADMTPDEAAKFRVAFLTDIMKGGEGWRGMVKENARRLCEILLHHPELIEESAPNEIPYDLTDLQFFAEHMAASAFNKIMDQALDMEAFASEELTKAKK